MELACTVNAMRDRDSKRDVEALERDVKSVFVFFICAGNGPGGREDTVEGFITVSVLNIFIIE